MRPRICEELELLREKFGRQVEHAEADGNDWFLIPAYQVPGGWRLDGEEVATVRVAFMINAGYPTSQPYAFLVPDTLRFGDAVPVNASDVGTVVPFVGRWRQLSWAPEESWSVSADVRQGANLFAWARSFRTRLLEGA